MRIITVLLFLGISFNADAQSLDDQFRELRDGSETFKVYKVIKQTELNAFWSVVMDSVKEVRSELAEAYLTIEKQRVDMSERDKTITGKDEEISELEYSASHISVLGIGMFKEAYLAISFTLVALLIAALVFLYGRSKTSIATARKKVQEYAKLNADYEEYKKDSLEKQMKLRRELQTQINKLEEIRSS